MSFVEAVVNIAVGYCLAILTQIFVFPLFGLHATMSENVLIGGIFTLISLVRSFILRRAFETVRSRRES